MTIMPQVIVEVGFTEGASTQDYLHLDDDARGILGTNTLGPDAIWTDISQWVHRVHIARGVIRVEGPVLRYEAGFCEIELDNRDRRFDPTNLSGPYVSAGVTEVTPMRAVRVRAKWPTDVPFPLDPTGLIYPLFRGFAEEWVISYEEPFYSKVTLQCIDATKRLRNINRIAVAGVGAGENTGTRVSRILNSGSWSVSDRSIQSGNTTCQATTLAGTVWDELLLVQDTEIGEIYIDEAGRVTFRNRRQSMEGSRTREAQALFGDQPVGTVPPGTAHPTPTTVNFARNPSIEIDMSDWGAGGTVPPTLTQSSAQAKFGTKSLLATWGTGGDLPIVTVSVPGLIIGRTYTASVYVYVPSGSPDVFTVLSAGSDFWDNLGEGTGLKDQWVRLTKTHICNSNTTTTWFWTIWPGSSPTSGQQVYIDGLQVEEGSVATPYVDGDQTPPPSTVIEWDYFLPGSTSRRLPELPYHGTTVEYDDETVANWVRITRVGGAEQSAQDPTSQQKYLIHTYDRSDLIMQSDTVALDYANLVLFQNKDPELRFATIDIAPQRDPVNLFPQVLDRGFGDRIRIRRRPPGGGMIERECFIRGVRHEIDKQSWATRWLLQSATKWSFLTLDHNTLGKLDENALGY